MPLHDWTRVAPGTFHHFHTLWIAAISEELNTGLLPDGYYAMAEQRAATIGPDVLTLHSGTDSSYSTPGTGGISVEVAPPRVSVHQTLSESAHLRLSQRRIAIRQAPEHRLIAVIEIISPANKDRPRSVQDFVGKAYDILHHGIHLLVVELFPPGLHDPDGLTLAIWEELGGEKPDASDPELLLVTPAKDRMTGSFVAAPAAEGYFEPLSVGDELPEMPLFLAASMYINVPLSRSYGRAYRGVPMIWQKRLVGVD